MGNSNPSFNFGQTTIGSFLKCLIVIAIGIVIFYIDDREFLADSSTSLLILFLCIAKCAYFIWVAFIKIKEVIEKDTPYHRFLVFVTANITVMITSFGVDFLCLYRIDLHSFIGIHPDVNTLPRQIFEFFYFSVLNFSFFGYGEIMPRTIVAKMVVMIEIITSFLAIILVLSDFISLKESILDERNKKIDS